ncbi:succinate dehydrogenase cytochrome b556 small membrane subunit [Yersinia frederiksenii]|uniref:Succinate dehydrogenase hydrophobic membrane anchor subunit n=2 Tax=Yersinia frederiksenii TaxID=29484 RepID=A0A380PZP1_YERFR|nr:succinate dehydrogenase membrane anchor subunit [Yersinia frederiksenii]ATM96683.1 succinate dehydrogenase, hydrophobic membrane anchor protein [Yersinia frederiksenii]KGA45521.1 succinate dehydrogenase, hydrophobic membrane anchor protein [Yersinia frederiksenii ATCC 33641]CNC03505.1 succinate dehydrogenase cytochrome b556 small membrane subunit [Yersinia frederiksenii]CNG19581.1 succinate dehydrogenase cytochrome b556 small membrane subunit [Yersinia frederiksenii]SUP78963.1 succinate deh
MVSNASALGRNGVHDWLLLRASAIVITLYVLYILGFVVIVPDITYEIWRGFFASHITKVFTLLTLLSILAHAWIGLWQVLTDYIKPLALRLVLQLAVVITLLVYLLYGTIVVWGA